MQYKDTFTPLEALQAQEEAKTSLTAFTRNMLLVFAGISLVNFFNLLFQLLTAHRLNPQDYAAFNSLLSIFMLISMPLSTLQIAVAKYSAEFNGQNQKQKIQILLSRLLKFAVILGLTLFFAFYFSSFYIMDKLKIYSDSARLIVAALLSLSCIMPLFTGGLQGLELFGWLTSAALISGAIKLLLAFLFILIGFNIAGALGALLVSILVGIFISYLPLRNFISLRQIQGNINFRDFFLYIFPVTICSFCFAVLVNLDMVLVKYFFLPQDSAVYSLAQVVGKIFLFLPGAISLVMFPRASNLNARKLDTTLTLKRSLGYAVTLCLLAIFAYNLLPAFTLKILTGKAYAESILLGRLFSISMTFFALLFILISYFLSIKDLRFIKYLILFTFLQLSAIILFHKSLIGVQLILCLNAILLFFIHLILLKRRRFSSRTVPVIVPL